MLDNQEYIERCKHFTKEVISRWYRKYEKLNSFPEEIHKDAHEWNLMNAGFPKELGGHGISHAALAQGGVEMARVCAPTAFSLGFNHGTLRPILREGTKWQKQVFIRDLLENNKYASWCMTESETSGTNLTAIETRAMKVKDGWIINGKKVMTGNGSAASLFLVLADAWEGDRRIGLSIFAVPKTHEIAVGTNPDKLGFRCLPTPDITFNEVFVSDEHVIGAPGAGFPILVDSLDYMRFGGGIITLGIATGALDDLLPWLESRKVYGGERLSDQSHPQIQIGRILGQMTGLEVLVLHVATLLDQGKQIGRESASVKLVGSELAIKTTDIVMQLHGWRGTDARFHIEKRFRDARETAIYEGTNEILAMNIFRRRLQEHRLSTPTERAHNNDKM